MATVFTMPQLGSTMEEGQILRWHKREGETVRKGDVLLEIETDKASMEVEAPMDGAVRKILHGDSATVAIRAPIAILGALDETIDDLLAEIQGTDLTQRRKDAKREDEAHTETQRHREGTGNREQGTEDLNTRTPEHPTLQIFLSPRARRVADENGVPIAALAGRGTGPDGRVVEKDVRDYLAEKQGTGDREQGTVPNPEPRIPNPDVRVTPLAARMADDLGIALSDLATGLPGSRVRREDVLRHAEIQGTGNREQGTEDSTLTAIQNPKSKIQNPYTLHPVSTMRRRIADNVAKSAFTAPHVTLTLETDMTEAAAFRQKLIPEIEKAQGARLTYTDILVKAVARALDEHPLLNSALVGDELRVYTAKNIGIAVALDEGLVVPVIKDVESKTLGAIAAELKPLIERARTGKFTPDDLADGTFSITNLGAFGIDVFDPIIVSGQTAILGVGRIAEKPVVVAGQIMVRTMMNLCLSFDHRAIDGAPAARFLQRLKELLENPLTILV